MVCRTLGGKLFTILFIVTSVPMWFSTLAQLGYFLHLLLFKTWSILRCYCCCCNFRWSVTNANGPPYHHRMKNSSVNRCCSLPVTPPFLFLAFVTFLSLGIMSYIMSYLEEKSFFEAFYFAVVTFSTVGLGDVVPTSTLGKLRLVALFVCSTKLLSCPSTAKRCLLVSFTVGFAILSAWISNVADIIYTRNFDPSIEWSPHCPRKSSDPAPSGRGKVGSITITSSI